MKQARRGGGGGGKSKAAKKQKKSYNNWWDYIMVHLILHYWSTNLHIAYSQISLRCFGDSSGSKS